MTTWILVLGLLHGCGGNDEEQAIELMKLRVEVKELQERVDLLSERLSAHDDAHDTRVRDAIEERERLRARSAPVPDLDSRVKAIDDNTWEVDPELFEDIDVMSSWARVIPHRGADGEIDGFRISGIRRSSVLAAMGVKNGDIVHQVGDQPVTSMAEAMEGYQAVADADTITLHITRRGQPQELHYRAMAK